MFKKIGTLLITVLSLGLLVYSASRSLNFISMTLPPDRQILAWAGLFAIEFGLLFWAISYLYGSQGWQRGIALLMTIIDLIGCVTFFTLDTLVTSSSAGITKALTQDEMQMAILALSAIIGINITATIAHHFTAPGQLKNQAAEEAFDKIESAALKQISANSESLAAELAPQIGSAWMENTRARYQANLSKPQAKAASVKLLPAMEDEALELSELEKAYRDDNAKKNGKVKYQSVTQAAETGPFFVDKK